LFVAVAGVFAEVALDEVVFLDSDEVFVWFAPASFTVSFDTDTVVLTFVVSFATDFSLDTVTVDVDAVDEALDAATFSVFGASLVSLDATFAAVSVAGALRVCSTVGAAVVAIVFTEVVVGTVVVFAGVEDLSELVHPLNMVANMSSPRTAMT
jgi:hypothetical protein